MAPATNIRRVTLALAAAALLAGCGDQGPKRDAAGAISQAGKAGLLTLHIGDCMTDLRERLENPDGSNNGVPKVQAVNCAAQHDAELVKIATIDGKEWPGFTIVDGEAARGRLELASSLDKARAEGGEVQIVSFRPTKERWNFENQHAIYYLELYDTPHRGAAPK